MKGDKLAALAVSVCGHACVAAAAITYLGSAAGQYPRPPIMVTLALSDARTTPSTPMGAPAAFPPTSGTPPAELQAAAGPEAAPATVSGPDAVQASTTPPVEPHPASAERQAQAASNVPAAPEQGTDTVAPIEPAAPGETAPQEAPSQSESVANDAAPATSARTATPSEAAQEVGAVAGAISSPAPTAANDIASATAAPLADTPVEAMQATPSAAVVGTAPASTVSATGASTAIAAVATPRVEAEPSRPKGSVAALMPAADAISSADSVAGTAVSPTSLPVTAPVSSNAEVLGPAQNLASLEAAPLSEPAPEQRVSLAPDLAQAAWRAQIHDFLENYDGGPCFYAVPDAGPDSRPAIGGFAAAPAKFVVLDWAFKTRVRLEPAIVAARIWTPQCGAVEFLRATARAPGAPPPPLIEVERSKLHGSDEIRGRIVNAADRPLGLFLISETGAVQDVTTALVRQGGGARFAFHPDHAAAGGPFPQMLVAVAADAAIPSRPATSDALFKPLLARPELQPSASAKLLLLTR